MSVRIAEGYEVGERGGIGVPVATSTVFKQSDLCLSLGVDGEAKDYRQNDAEDRDMRTVDSHGEQRTLNS